MEHIKWQEVAVGVGLVAIAAYFLFPHKSAQQVVTETVQQPAQQLANATQVPGIPSYLSSNRPAWSFVPTDPVAQAVWSGPHSSGVGGTGGAGLPGLGGGLVLPDSVIEISPGSYVGGNYTAGSFSNTGGSTLFQGGNFVGGGVAVSNNSILTGGDGMPFTARTDSSGGNCCC